MAIVILYLNSISNLNFFLSQLMLIKSILNFQIVKHHLVKAYANCSEDLGNVEYSLIAITIRSTVTQSGSNIYGSNRTV